MNHQTDWETVDEQRDQFETRRTARLKVFGGYLYRYEIDTPFGENARATQIAMTYVPTPPKKRADQ